jgi:hypothetical protein
MNIAATRSRNIVQLDSLLASVARLVKRFRRESMKPPWSICFDGFFPVNVALAGQYFLPYRSDNAEGQAGTPVNLFR